MSQRPTQQDLDDAKAYGDACRYLIERAEKRLAHAFDDQRREALTMVVLLNAAWDMCKRHEVTDPTRFHAMTAAFMSGVGKLTGAIVEEEVVEALSGKDAWNELDRRLGGKGDDDGSVH